jgi:hypothetical protein
MSELKCDVCGATFTFVYGTDGMAIGHIPNTQLTYNDIPAMVHFQHILIYPNKRLTTKELYQSMKLKQPAYAKMHKHYGKINEGKFTSLY